MAEIKTDSNVTGQVQISDEVIAVIAGTASMEVDGVVSTSGNLTSDMMERLGAKKNFSKGVKIDVDGSDVCIDIGIAVKFGVKVQEVATEVQKKVKNAVETMTGLNVLNVNVSVLAVNFEKDKNKDI